MEFLKLFNQFAENGRLACPGTEQNFAELPWAAHPTFTGVELKKLIGGAQTNGEFSFHLVRIAPGCQIGSHTHPSQLETHEVIAGSGLCVNNGAQIAYAPGVISIMPAGVPHQVSAGSDGLYLSAKFMPALA